MNGRNLNAWKINLAILPLIPAQEVPYLPDERPLQPACILHTTQIHKLQQIHEVTGHAR